MRRGIAAAANESPRAGFALVTSRLVGKRSAKLGVVRAEVFRNSTLAPSILQSEHG
jgi:hypothetical protein